MSADKPVLHPESLAAQGMGRVAMPYRDIVPPIYVSTTYERGADGAFPGGRIYSRADNPTYDQAESLIAALEGAPSAMLFASGQAAAAAVFQALAPGACALVPRNMYWAFRKWLLEFAAPWGLAIEFYENASIDELTSKARAVRPRLIWIETPANPTWDITDIAAASAIAREVGAILAVDSTAATPMLTRPLELGADLVMHSATKYLNGHSDVIAGALATARDDELWQRIRYVRGGGGAVLGPMEAWLLLRGMRTLHLRVAAACVNALAIAQRFHGHPRLSHVLYPGLPSHPGHAVAARQMHGGFGGMISLRLKDGEEAAKSFTAKLRGVQARDLARVGRKPGRTSRQRRGTRDAVPRGPRAAVDRRRARQRPDRRHRAGPGDVRRWRQTPQSIEVECVSDAVNRPDDFLTGRNFREFSPHVLDVAVDRAVEHDAAVFIQPVQQFVTRMYPAGRGGQRLQQPEFNRRQRNRASIHRDFIARLIEEESPRATAASRGYPSQHRMYPRHDFARAERFADVIVRAHFQSPQTVHFIHARGDHDDRQRVERSHLATYGQAILARQHQVEQHEGRFVLADFRDGRIAVADAAWRKPIGREIVGQQPRELRLVLDDQDDGARGWGAQRSSRTSGRRTLIRSPPMLDALASMSP